MQPVLKRGLHWFGSGLAVIGVVFVVMRLHTYGARVDLAVFDTPTWAGMTFLAIVYGLANLLLALAWWNLLQHFGVCVSRQWAIATYGVTQLAKYTPGNIFHLAGRQAVGMATGLPGWPLAKSAGWELGLLSGIGAMFGILSLPCVLPFFSGAWASLGFVCAIGTVAFALGKFAGKPALRAYFHYALFLAVSGLVFSALMYLLTGGRNDLPWMEICGTYILAWLAGLVTPGAPAGAGVREMVLLFLLRGIINESDLLLAVVWGRLITVSGDVMFFGYGALLRRTLPDGTGVTK